MNLPAANSGGRLAPVQQQRLPVATRAALPPAIVRGPWQLTRLIRRGQHTDIIRARLAQNDLGPGCYVLKMARTGGDPRTTAMLRREALIAGQAVHPHLVTALAADFRDAPPYIVLPYLEGLTLRRLLNHVSQPAHSPWPITTALSIVRQIAEALAAMHSARWLHGQVRPEHVIVSPQGQATLIDLTFTRRLESSECEVGADDCVALTYAAPESWRLRGRLTAAADTYSLGAVLFELLSGRAVFAARDARELAALHRTAAPPDLRRLRPEASLECAELVRRMLAKEPLRRPGDEELICWLAEIEIAELAV